MRILVKAMIKKVLLSIIVLILAVSPISAAEDTDCKLINALNYHKGMFAAARSETYLKVPIGSSAAEIGGDEQDVERYTSGVPYAFRPAENGGVWILDSVNKALKLFASDGVLAKSISIAEFGPVVRDFAFDGSKGFWLLCAVDGFIYRIDMTGKLLSQIEGFFGANAIETGPMGELLVDMPSLSSVLRFSNDETLKEQYSGDESLSMIEGLGGKLLDFERQDKLARLRLLDVASPAAYIDLAEFPLDIEDPAVNYVAAQVNGCDKDGNIYLSLIACHETSGAIYRDRIYRCSVAGKILAQKDIIIFPCLSSDLPRERVVTEDGKIMTYYLDSENNYVLAVYSL